MVRKDNPCEKHTAQGDKDTSEPKVRKERGWFYKLISLIVYGKHGDVIKKGNSLELDDLYSMNSLDLNALLEEFSDGWKKEGELEKKYGRRRPGFRLMRTMLLRCFVRAQILTFCVGIFGVAIQMVAYVYLYKLLDIFEYVPIYRAQGEHVNWFSVWKVAIIYVLNNFLGALEDCVFFNTRIRVSAAMQFTLLSATYKQMLNGKGGNNLVTVGKISMISSGHSAKIRNFYQNYMGILFIPLNIIGLLAIGIYLVGFIFCIGIGFLSIGIFSYAFIIKRVETIYEQINRAQGERVKITCKTVYSILQVKFWGWEKNCGEEIKYHRANEAHFLDEKFLIERCIAFALNLLTQACIILLIMLWIYSIGTFDLKTTIITYSLINDYNNLLGLAINRVVNEIAPVWVPINTLEELLRLGSARNVDSIEYDALLCKHDSIPPCEHSQREGLKGSISLHGSFRIHSVSSDRGLEAESPRDGFVLKDLDIEVLDGELLCILGPTGSGKTFLLMAMLQEAGIFSPSSKKQLPQYNQPIVGRMAYAGQEPWVQSATIRENILFGSNFDTERYNAVIRDCGLEADLKVLVHGDLTIIGSRGIKLSGGQKARVCLARLAYKDADVYILDEPLSSVDSGTGREIYNNLICRLLRGKTRVLVTHHSSHLLNDEKVIVMGNEGVIQAAGTWADVKKVPYFSKMHLSTDVFEEEDDLGLFGLLSVHSLLPKYVPETNMNKEISEIHSTDANFKMLVDHFLCSALGWKRSVLFICLIIFNSFTIFSLVLYLTQWATSPTYRSEVGMWSLGFATLSLIASFSMYAFHRIFYINAVEENTMLHDKMTDAILRAPMAFFDNNNSGKILNRFSSDMVIVDKAITETTFAVAVISISVICGLIAASATNVLFLPFAVFFVFLGILIMRIYLPCVCRLRLVKNICRSNLHHAIIESVEGVVTIRAFHAQDYLTSVFQRYLVDCFTANWAEVELVVWLANRLSLLGAIMIACMISIFVAMLALDNNIVNAAIMSGMISISTGMALQLRGLFHTVAELVSKSISLDRVMEYGNIEQESAGYSPEGKGPPDNWPSKGRISVANLWARYGTNLPYVLRGMSFEIHPGMCVGLVGRTGCGKSTLVKTLFRVLEYDSSLGYIEIDGIKTCNVGLQELRPRISIVAQEPFAFSGTIRYNLDPSGKSSDVEIWEILEIVHLTECITSLDTEMMSEECDNFSTGQKQLVCFARSLLRKSAIYVMDEPTAFIDCETDSLVIAGVKDLLKNATCLMVAHRLNTIIGADKVLVMESGEVVEYGCPHELLKDEDSIFAQIVSDSGAQEQLKRAAQESRVASSVLPNVNGG